MSMTIFGGETRNGVRIDDMVDDNRDFGYFDDRFKGAFVRLSQHLTIPEDGTSAVPAIVLFTEDAPYVPIYATVLKGSFDDYVNKRGATTEAFHIAKERFWDMLEMLEEFQYLKK